MADIGPIKTEILQRIDLIDRLHQELNLVRKGSFAQCCCPFHKEKTPSFTVWPDHFYCFGCKESGDAISYEQKKNGLGFIEALKVLAHDCGLRAQLDEVLNEDRKFTANKSSLNLSRKRKMMHLAQKWYQSHLADHPEAIQYLLERGFTKDEVHSFGFGFGSSRSKNIIPYLIGQGFKKEEILELSVGGSSDAGTSKNTESTEVRVYDFFFERLTIPIQDQGGLIVGFGGRVIAEKDRAATKQRAKYKNSRENILFDKSKLLFNFASARAAMRQKNRALIVEGYMDVLMLVKYGFQESVSIMGTALQFAQIKKIAQQTSKIYLIMDGDAAGKAAAFAAAKVFAQAQGVDVFVGEIPNQWDPDTFLRNKGQEAFEEEIIAPALGLFDYVIEKSFIEHDALVAIQKDLLPLIQHMQDPVKKEWFLSKVSSRSGISKEAILQQAAQKVVQKSSPKGEGDPSELRDQNASDEAIWHWLERDPTLYSLTAHLLLSEEISSQAGQNLLRDLKALSDDVVFDSYLDIIETLLRFKAIPPDSRSEFVSSQFKAFLQKHKKLFSPLLGRKNAFSLERESGRLSIIESVLEKLKKDRKKKKLMMLRSQFSRFDSDQLKGFWEAYKSLE